MVNFSKYYKCLKLTINIKKNVPFMILNNI